MTHKTGRILLVSGVSAGLAIGGYFTVKYLIVKEAISTQEDVESDFRKKAEAIDKASRESYDKKRKQQEEYYKTIQEPIDSEQKRLMMPADKYIQEPKEEYKEEEHIDKNRK